MAVRDRDRRRYGRVLHRSAHRPIGADARECRERTAGRSAHGEPGPVPPSSTRAHLRPRSSGFWPPCRRRPRRHRRGGHGADRAGNRGALALVVAAGVAVAAGMTTMALLAWSYFGWRLSRIARALERTLETEEPGPAARGRHPGRAASGQGLQRRRRRLPPDRGARDPRSADRHPEPRDPARDPGRRGRARRPPLQAAQRRLHRHRPLQADQRHLRPQLRRRGAAPDRRASSPMPSAPATPSGATAARSSC